jgi:hypothetical protein
MVNVMLGAAHFEVDHDYLKQVPTQRRSCCRATQGVVRTLWLLARCAGCLCVRVMILSMMGCALMPSSKVPWPQ